MCIQALAKDRMKAIFREIEDAPDRKAMFAHARRSQSRRSIENAIVLTRSEPGIAADLTDFDTDPWVLNVANGTLDLRTGQLRPHAKADHMTKLAPVEYDPNASCELWDAFLWRITDHNQELYDYARIRGVHSGHETQVAEAGCHHDAALQGHTTGGRGD